MPRIRAATIDEHKALTRGALLDAAYQVIAEAGTAEVALGEIALRAGVGRTTFYEYFDDRDDVIASLVEDRLPLVIADILSSVDKAAPSPDRLADLARRTVEFVTTDQVLGVILHREAGRLGLEAQVRIAAAHRELSAEMARLHAVGVKEGSFDDMPPRLAGMLIQETIMAGAKALIERPDSDSEALLEMSIGFLMRGLGSPRPADG